MTKVVDKTPLQSRTALNHLRTVKRAVEVVGSWPEWKRDTVLFRDKSTPADAVGTTASGDNAALRKRSA